MTSTKPFYKPLHAIYSVLMILALAWLTVSLPFVQQCKNMAKCVVEQADETQEADNPFSNTTEEKTESGVNTLSEYLHEAQWLESQSLAVIRYYRYHPVNQYLSHKPELFSPPPEA